MNRPMRNLLWVAVLAVIAIAIARSPISRGSGRAGELPYSEFIAAIGSFEVRTVTVENLRARGELADGRRFRVDLPDNDRARGDLIAMLVAQQERQPDLVFSTPTPHFSKALQNVFVSVLIPLGAIVLLWVLFWRQAQRAAQPEAGPAFCVGFPHFQDLQRESRAAAREIWQTLLHTSHSWLKATETLPDIQLRAGDLILVKASMAPEDGGLVVLDDGGLPRVRRYTQQDGEAVFTGGPDLSPDARLVGTVELVVRRT
jgi:hypothetical protein